MSTASKVTLALSLAGTAATIGYVSYQQAYDRERLRQGITRDLARQEMKKRENTYRLQEQIELEKIYREASKKET